jgi:8-amino-7-oxononanoate synthase
VNANQRFDAYLQEKLDEREDNGLLRNLTTATGKIDFSSNDYLGFSQLNEFNKIEQEALASGATGSRLITGNSLLAESTEKMIAAFHRAESALIFNTGIYGKPGIVFLYSCQGRQLYFR